MKYDYPNRDTLNRFQNIHSSTKQFHLRNAKFDEVMQDEFPLEKLVMFKSQATNDSNHKVINLKFRGGEVEAINSGGF